VTNRRWFSAWQLVLAGLVGLAVGIGAFLVTGSYPRQLYMGFCDPVVQAGFNPLSGLPHGVTLYCAPLSIGGPAPSPSTTYVPMPADLAGRWAIPVPLGFVAGAALVLVALKARKSRREPAHRV
jgi:hypothetical protein